MFGWNSRGLFRETEKRVITNSRVDHSGTPVETLVLPRYSLDEQRLIIQGDFQNSDESTFQVVNVVSV